MYPDFIASLQRGILLNWLPWFKVICRSMISGGTGQPWGRWKQCGQMSTSYNLFKFSQLGSCSPGWRSWIGFTGSKNLLIFFLQSFAFMSIFSWGSHERLDFNRGCKHIKNHFSLISNFRIIWRNFCVALIISIIVTMLLGVPGGLRPGALGPRTQKLPHGALTLLHIQVCSSARRFLQVSHILVAEKLQGTKWEIHDTAEAKCLRILPTRSCLQEQSLGRRGEQRGHAAGREVSDDFLMLASPLVENTFILTLLAHMDHKGEECGGEYQERCIPTGYLIWSSNRPLGYVGCVMEFLFFFFIKQVNYGSQRLAENWWESHS